MVLEYGCQHNIPGRRLAAAWREKHNFLWSFYLQAPRTVYPQGDLSLARQACTGVAYVYLKNKLVNRCLRKNIWRQPLLYDQSVCEERLKQSPSKSQ